MKKIKLLIVFCLILESAFAQVQDFIWAKRFGEISDDGGKAITVDKNGNVYSTGYFNGATDFDPDAGTFILNAIGGSDIFISKLDANGNFLWAKSMGGISNEEGSSIAVDEQGNVYSTGIFSNTIDLDPGIGIANFSSFGNSDFYISKLDSAGNFLWAKQIGGISRDFSRSIAIDFTGNVVLTGGFNGTVDFDPDTLINSPLTTNGSGDVFVLKLTSAGEKIWAVNMGGGVFDYGYSLALDPFGNIYTTGVYQGQADFDPGILVNNLNSVQLGADIFVSKLNASGNFVWAKSLGGIADEYGLGIAVDKFQNVYTTGVFGLTADFDPGVSTFDLVSGGFEDIFVSKLDVFGNFVWAKSFKGTNLTPDAGNSISLDTSGNVYTTGYYQATLDFDPSLGIFNLTSAGGADVFISKLNANGDFIWAKSFGGSSSDYANSIYADKKRSILTTGTFGGVADFDPDSTVFNLTAFGINNDAFVHKLGSATVGLSEFEFDNQLTIYPNPFNDILTLSIPENTPNADLLVYNSQGSLVYRKMCESGTNEINLSTLSNGLYLIRVKSENKISKLAKFIKK